MNFVATFEQGQQGRNMGLPTGIPRLDRGILGIQKKKIYVIAAAPKIGKTTFADFVFILAPYLLSPNAPVIWTYFSYEMDRVSKEFKFAAFFLFWDYNISTLTLDGVVYPVTGELLQGKVTKPGPTPDSDPVVVLLDPDTVAKLQMVYRNRIIPLFGEYDTDGNKISAGRINFIEDRAPASIMEGQLMAWCRMNGTFKEVTYNIYGTDGIAVPKTRIVNYVANDPDLFHIVITDHMRKVPLENKQTLKQAVDAWSDAQARLRNLCGLTFVDIIHLNRSIGTVERIKHGGEFLYPNGDDVKDSGNLSEDTNVMITLFNPNDEKYNLDKHFGLQLKDEAGNELHPNYRSVHIVESRETLCPAHIQVNMFGNVNYFTQIG